LVVIRRLDEEGTTKHDYYLSDAPPETLPGVLARVAKAEHRVERCLQRGKSEAGLAESQVRTWSGWHHHQALSLIATWFLVQESRRGKKGDAGADGAAGAHRSGFAAACGVRL
jgi:SRSO17 transposase